MRMTASWLDPAVGSTEYKDVARDLCAPPSGRLASDRSDCLSVHFRESKGFIEHRVFRRHWEIYRDEKRPQVVPPWWWHRRGAPTHVTAGGEKESLWHRFCS